MVSNGKPNIPSNRPNVQPMQQQQRNTNNETKQANKLRDKPTAMMAMFMNPNGGPRSEYLYISDIFDLKRYGRMNEITRKNTYFTMSPLGS
jgi:hypothetical protein